MCVCACVCMCCRASIASQDPLLGASINTPKARAVRSSILDDRFFWGAFSKFANDQDSELPHRIVKFIFDHHSNHMGIESVGHMMVRWLECILLMHLSFGMHFGPDLLDQIPEDLRNARDLTHGQKLWTLLRSTIFVPQDGVCPKANNIRCVALCGPDLSVEEYVEMCKAYDNKDYFVAKKDCRSCTSVNQCPEVRDYTRELRKSGVVLQTDRHKIIEIRRMVLGGRGRANRVIESYTGDSKDKCWLFEFGEQDTHGVSQTVLLQRVDMILGVDNNGVLTHLRFFGPQWRARRVANLFEVYETNAMRDFLGRRSLPLNRVAYPCRVQHKHRVARSADHCVWEQITQNSSFLETTQVCRFDIVCDKHAHEAPNFCKECMHRVIRGGDKKPGSRKCVQITKKGRSCRNCVHSSVDCRHFKDMSGSIRCLEIYDFVDWQGSDEVVPNCDFRVYSGNSGWLPGLYEKRSKLWDQGMRTHLGANYL